MVRAEGLEPPRPKSPEPKSGVSANFTTPAHDMWFWTTMSFDTFFLNKIQLMFDGLPKNVSIKVDDKKKPDLGDRSGLNLKGV